MALAIAPAPPPVRAGRERRKRWSGNGARGSTSRGAPHRTSPGRVADRRHDLQRPRYFSIVEQFIGTQVLSRRAFVMSRARAVRTTGRPGCTDALCALVQALRTIQVSQGDHPWLLLDLTMAQFK